MMGAAEILKGDRARVWHPYASPFGVDPLYAVTAASGARLLLNDGEREYPVVDAMASWWSAIHGYRHPALDAAIAEQAGRFSHVMFGGLTHDPAVRLAGQLIELAPTGLSRVFLADSGSVAMEVALKIARQVGMARPRSRTKFAALRGGYHGDTWGTMAVSDPDGGMHALYAGQVQQHVFLPRPPAFTASVADVAGWESEVSDLIHAHRDELTGIVVEPILQGAGGMWPWAPGALRHLRRLADAYELVLIADEVATGFGRTGRLWACDWAGVRPDVMAVGKALTGGYLTQAAVLTTDPVTQAIADGPASVLMHGPTFMANPLASAVSSASVELVAQGGWRARVQRIGRVLSADLDGVRERPGVSDVRVFGATATIALEMPVDVAAATRAALAHGVWLRPFRNLVYAMPPYVATDEELHTIATGMRAAVDAVVAAHVG